MNHVASDRSVRPPSPNVPSHVGPHEIQFEAPDVLRVVMHGDILADHMLAMYDIVESMAAGPASLFILQDLSRSQNFTAGARKTVASEPRADLIAGVASFGESFQMRVMVAMLDKASRLFGRQRVTPSGFFATETLARDWIAERRRQTAAR